jgi:hypothetical protein
MFVDCKVEEFWKWKEKWQSQNEWQWQFHVVQKKHVIV